MRGSVSHGAATIRSARVLTMMMVASLLLVIAAQQPAAAHENRVVGEYRLTVGWINEPAYAGIPNAVDLRVSFDEDEEPVEDLGDSLQVEITYGDETMTADLRPRFNEPGAYRSDLVPTRPGTWEFRFFGTIEDLEIDETFTSGPETFNDIQEVSAAAFPTADPSTAELAERLERELARVDDQPAATDTDENAAAGGEAAAADTSDGVARTTGIVALILGAAGVLLALRRRPA